MSKQLVPQEIAGNHSIPGTWKWMRFGSVMEMKYGKSLRSQDRDESGIYPVFGSGGMVGTHSDAITEAPCIVVGRKGSIGASYYSNKPCWPIDTTYYIDSFPDFLFPQYVAYYLRTLRLQWMNKSAAIPGLNRDDVHALAIPIPFVNQPERAIEFQRRIVARIEALLTELKDCRDLLDEMRMETEQLLGSVLKDVLFNQQSLTDWNEQTIEAFCEKPQYGYTASGKNKPIGPKFLRITDIQNSSVDWSEVPYCQMPENLVEKYCLQQGDILFARTGATTGKTFLVQDCPLAVFASYLIRLRVKSTVLPEYLAWFFRSPQYWDQVKPRGGAQPNMNATLLQAIKVIYPINKNVQRQLVKYFETTESNIRDIMGVIEQDARLLYQLEQSILDRAFRGEL